MPPKKDAKGKDNKGGGAGGKKGAAGGAAEDKGSYILKVFFWSSCSL